MLDEYLIQTCYLVTTTRNLYGDYIYSSQAAIPCRFRETNTTQRATHGENNESDAMIWVSTSSGVAKGSIIMFENIYYQVERITKARRLGEDTVQFLKCDLKTSNVGIS